MSKTEKKCWSESFGFYGSTIRIAEREPGGILYLLWIDKEGKQWKRSLGHRDRKQGKKQALELANHMAGKPAVEKEAGPLTISEGIARAFAPLRGMYAGDTRHARQARALAERAAAKLEPGLTWAELTPGTVLYLARRFAQERTDGKGVRAAEYACVVLYTVAGWLREERLIPETAALPRRGWKTKLREEWRALTGRTTEPARPRHSVEEVRKFFGALPQGDPRLWLLVELAAELRAGQAVRGRRSDLNLAPVGGYGLGRFVVRGAGKKLGEVVDLHPELRALVDHVLTDGYLSEAEAAYQRGELADYFLFPAGRLRQGRAPAARVDRQPLGPTAIRNMFCEVERLAGVEHQPGRAFYGLRRQATDLAPEFAQDARVLNRLSGHAESSTRERVFQDQENELVRARAAKARRKMRRHLGASSPAALRGVA